MFTFFTFCCSTDSICTCPYFLYRRTERKTLLGRYVCRHEDKLKQALNAAWGERLNCAEQAQDTVHWQTLLKMVRNFL
jgi:hypothetical protein